jgi:hypothetical protein
MPLGFEKPPSNANPSDRTFLFHIRQVCINPQLANDTSRPALATKAFADWLDGFFVVSNIYFPTLNVQMDLHLERCRCLKICGDVVKHSLPRLETNVKHLRTIHEEAGYKVSEQEAYLVLEDFVNWLHNSVFLYHASQIGEFLNNIRWSIYMYLRSEYQSSWHVVGPKAGDIQQYFYNVPSSVSDALSQSMYWDLMNRVRSRPSVEPFLAPDYLKVRY